ncbi:UHRF1-binding protein 1-like [Trema orientale]|uniref:UHRF1-binding protein 1-like n=1 Tax=Trema orientale TaxID=63057 RepID=A0A2P5FRT5_TREOI|nr:UHRF1-binding protein 1-like [Trema orientale]
MESILARALEYTLKYWLKSFSRDQFKLQGRTVQLSNLDINGDALHSSVGFPPALNVTTAKVGKLEIVLPSVSNVQVEPIIVQIDRLDLVLEENPDVDACRSPISSPSPSSSAKGSGYGFADKIADGMTVEIRTVNLLLETRGGARQQGGASWVSPLASITIRNLLLYTTNEDWQVVNLKEARDFSNDKKFIYVFKKLEWESLSIDLLPHPDMFMDANVACSQEGGNQRDDDGAKRAFFGGERFIEGISGEAYITVQRTELNSPLGLEVQLHITEAICPALSEPGLRALLRFLTGLYVCLNRGDVDPKAQQRSIEAAGRSLISIVVDHIFLCIKDAEFQLELLMQSLFFSRASVSDGENDNNLTKVMISGLFLRDTFSRPPCTLVQPSMHASAKEPVSVPEFAKNFCPPIYPLGEQQWQLIEGVSLLSLHSLQIKPSPVPPLFASQTVINCQPLMIHLQEESCLRISSFLADGVVVNPGSVLPDFSINSFIFNLKELEVTVPLDPAKLGSPENVVVQNSFTGARLHIENLFFSESPSLKLKLLNLEKDPACFCLWEGQPVDASQKKWTTGASDLSLSLETSTGLTGFQSSLNCASGLWRCVELKDARIEVAMVTADGSPLTNVPPPGGIVRIGVACEQYLSNTSVEQLFFVLDLYAYFGRVSEKIVLIGKNARQKKSSKRSSHGRLMDKVPSDTGVSLVVQNLQLRFLESCSMDIQEMPLVQFVGNDVFIKVTHRTLGGAIAVSSTLRWDNVEVDCVETEGNVAHQNGTALISNENGLSMCGNGYPQLKAVLWVHNQKNQKPNRIAFVDPFLDITVEHVIPLNEEDIECHSLNVSACISGVRLGGGMNYAEALLLRFGILGPDGGPGKGLSKGLDNLRAGPLSKLFNSSSIVVSSLEDDGSSGDGKESALLHLGKPDDVDVSIELKNWLFALEGAQEMAESWWFSDNEHVGREERCWHTSFQNLRVKAKSSPKKLMNGKSNGVKKYPVELVTVGVEGLQTLKPYAQKGNHSAVVPANGMKETVETVGGINVEARIVISENNIDEEMVKWIVENVKFSVKEPIEAIVTKDELQHLAFLCKSEVDSMGRITAGVLRLLKLEGSVGQAAINQLSNLGTEGIDKIFSPEKLSRGSSAASIGLPPLNLNGENSCLTLESTVASLEHAVVDSQAKCAALTSNLEGSESSANLAIISQLTQKLESMQSLLTRLRTQI